MAQKTRKDGEKSPSDSVAPSNCIDIGSVVDPGYTTGGQQERSPVEKKVGGNLDGGILPSGELSELEQQKLAGKKKGTYVIFKWNHILSLRFYSAFRYYQDEVVAIEFRSSPVQTSYF